MLLKKCTIPPHSPSGHVIPQTLCIQVVYYDVIPDCVFCNSLVSILPICSQCSHKHRKTFKPNLYYLLEIGHKGIKSK